MADINHKAEIAKIINAINKAWLNNKTEYLKDFFHEKMTITDSNFNKLASNKKECIASYESFIKQAKVLSYTEHDINIEIIGNTAIVNYVFDISWEVKDNISSEKGRDVFVFEFINGKWLENTIIPDDKSRNGNFIFTSLRVLTFDT